MHKSEISSPLCTVVDVLPILEHVERTSPEENIVEQLYEFAIGRRSQYRNIRAVEENRSQFEAFPPFPGKGYAYPLSSSAQTTRGPLASNKVGSPINQVFLAMSMEILCRHCHFATFGPSLAGFKCKISLNFN